MAIPAEIANIIALAKTQESAENQLEEYRNRKAACQDEIADLNIKIANQVTVVQAARAALKTAAGAL